MRKIIGVLVGVALVLMVGSANAANNGTGDPLGLIASAAIQPFYSAGPGQYPHRGGLAPR